MTKDTATTNQRPTGGVGVFMFRGGKFLMMKRQGAHQPDTWSLPGGHIEYGESFEDTTRREILEETGCEVENIRFGAVTNDIFRAEGKHNVTVWTLCDWKANEPKIMEPYKCSEIAWKDFNTLPEPLFASWNQLIPSEFYVNIQDQLKTRGGGTQ